jgi:nucleotide-binding universal stress UspA family protein
MTPTIVVGYDGSEASRAALLFAARQAGVGGRVIIVHSYRLPRRGRRSREYAKALAAEHDAGARLLGDLPLGDPELVGPSFETELLGGPVARALEAVARSHNADEIVIGTRGETGGLNRGSVSRALLGIADRPVVVIPAAAAELEHGVGVV